MSLTAEFALLVSAATRTWLSHLGPLVTWCCLGWAVQRASMNVSVELGPVVPTLAMIIFIVGTLVQVSTLVVMIHLLASTPPAGTNLPNAARATSSAQGTITMALGPFLAVYALWGLVDESLSELFVINVLRHQSEVDAWSVNLSRWTTYAVIAIGAWVIKMLALLASRRIDSQVIRLLQVLSDGVVVFASFLALLRISEDARLWLTGRVVWRWGSDVWAAMLGVLDRWNIFGHPWGQLVGQAVEWVAEIGLASFGTAIALPLMWLALTAIVNGWHQLDQLPRANPRLQRATALLSGKLAPVKVVARWSSTDLRHKYLPVWQALRWVLGVGARFLGVYLLSATVITAAGAHLHRASDRLLAELAEGTQLMLRPALDLVITVLITTMSVALYSAAYRRCRSVDPVHTQPVQTQPVQAQPVNVTAKS